MQYFCIQFAFNSKLYLSFSFYPDTLHLVIVSHSVIVLTTFFNELMGKKTKASKMALFQQQIFKLKQNRGESHHSDVSI